MRLRVLKRCFLLALAWGGTSASAADISFTTGFYQSEKTKVDGEDGGGRTVISLGGRYSNVLSENYYWFGEALFEQKEFDAADGQTAPDDGESMAISAGARRYFFRFSDNVVPFLSAKAGYKVDKDADTANNIQTESNGLYYYGSAGFRFWASKDIFLELESNLFESALFATEKSKPIDDTGEDAPPETETTKSELFVGSYNGIESVLLGIGMKL